MLELQNRAKTNGEENIVSLPNPNQKSGQGVPQPPASPIYQRLTESLGRPLGASEAKFVRQLQDLYEQARFRAISEGEFCGFGGHGNFFSYQSLDLWPKTPDDDFQMWLYIAWEMRRRSMPLPDFMLKVTDFSLVEPIMTKWARSKEIEQWKHWFRDFDHRASTSRITNLDLRLVILPKEARFQWRSGPEASYAELKQTQAKNFATQFERGLLNITPASLPLWGAAFKPWSYDSWWNFKYDSVTTRPTLNRLLRLPLDHDRIVSEDGQPLSRPAAGLRLVLRPNVNAHGDYDLTLVTSDECPAPAVLCAFPGDPALYLSERAIFFGPNPQVLDTELKKTIPAPALESAKGLQFLHAVGIPTPEHLTARVQTVPVIVKLSCALKPVYAGSPQEQIVITAAATAQGLASEIFMQHGWEPSRDGKEPRKARLPGNRIPIYDRAAQKHFPHLLEYLGARPEYNGEWVFRLTKKNIESFVAWLQSMPPEIEVLLDPELLTLRNAPVSGSVALDVQESEMDWFDLKVVLNVSDTDLTPEELNLLLNARGAYVRLGRKGWRRLKFDLTAEEDEQLARLGLNPRDLTAEPQRFHALQLADDAAKKFLAPEQAESIRRRASELQTRVTPPLPPGIHAVMRPYQTEGFHFLAYLTTNNFGGVLADDMGLGKTLQTLAWLAWLRELRDNEPAKTPAREPNLNGSEASASRACLVVCPKSVMDNWRSEAERFYPALRVRLWRGESIEELSVARGQADLIVLNYAQLRSLSPGITDQRWLAVILDEAQCIKNPDSQTAQISRALKTTHRLALTGTPIENRLLDLWSIFGFAMPGALGNRAHFLRRFNSQEDPLARRRLAARVRPFLLRRAKSQVARDLPDRAEEDLFCEMAGPQLTLYRAELKRARQIILGLKSNQQLNAERFNILTSLLRLRQICCHPALVDGKLHAAESAKVTALEDLLEPILAEGHKVLVFSQFVTMLDLLRENMKQHNWPHYYLAGDTENRGDLVREFQTAQGGAVFLISLKAGGFGLNLTAASYVVLFDPWWNPAVENQAIDRTHRIGQTTKVMAYRLLMRESIEQKIRALQKQKAALAADVLGEERFAQSLTLDDLKFLFAE
jgi:hypothetical protein